MPDLFTPTERVILRALSDGMAHEVRELRACVPDELAGKHALRMHVSNLRKKLNQMGQSILCEYRDKKFHYRHVVLLASGSKSE